MDERMGRSRDRKRIRHEAGLDGLRAIAVAGVFLYHANVGWMPGGFLGVDLFFVLSGYLITSLLLREFSQRGSIELRAFWGRRARRLFPAVAVVIVFALLATLTIARDDLGRTRADAISALVYLTNWHEIIASHSYFNQFGRPSLLQHLWSLAVEEQFYLLWPLLLIVGLRWLRRAGTVVLTALLAAGSCALMWTTLQPGRRSVEGLLRDGHARVHAPRSGRSLAFAWPVGRAASGAGAAEGRRRDRGGRCRGAGRRAGAVRARAGLRPLAVPRRLPADGGRGAPCWLRRFPDPARSSAGCSAAGRCAGSACGATASTSGTGRSCSSRAQVSTSRCTGAPLIVAQAAADHRRRCALLSLRRDADPHGAGAAATAELAGPPHAPASAWRGCRRRVRGVILCAGGVGFGLPGPTAASALQATGHALGASRH